MLTLVDAVEHKRSFFNRLWRHIRGLAKFMKPAVDAVWRDRQHIVGALPPADVELLFGDDSEGIVDTYPIRVRRPKLRSWRKSTRQGKYKDYILKVQVVSNFAGVPILVTGPHIGVRHDIMLWRRYGPPDMFVLGDKAYIGADNVSTPFKKPRGGSLTDAEEDYNVVHNWYRAGVEHSNAQLKKWKIVNTRYRGQLHRDNGKLEAILTIITCIIQMQVMASPLRQHDDILAVAGVDDLVDAAAGDVRAADAVREVVNGMEIGRAGDVRRVVVDGREEFRGPRANDEDDEPRNEHIDTGFEDHDFTVGDRVFVWWWTLWWRASILHVSRTRHTVTVRWDWNNARCSGYEPRLIMTLL